jgi:hypothetical protein
MVAFALLVIPPGDDLSPGLDRRQPRRRALAAAVDRRPRSPRRIGANWTDVPLTGGLQAFHGPSQLDHPLPAAIATRSASTERARIPASLPPLRRLRTDRAAPATRRTAENSERP